MKGLLVLVRGWTDDKDFRDKFASGEFPSDFIKQLSDSNPGFDIKVPKLPMSLLVGCSKDQSNRPTLSFGTNCGDYLGVVVTSRCSAWPSANT